MTVLVMAAILIFGIAAYRLLPVNTLPNVDFPTIQVNAELPGASPETMASAVATPLEKQFSTIAGIDSMTSISGQGSTSITIQFSLERDIDAAAQDVNSAIAGAARQMPPTMSNPPSFRKVNPADFPVYYLALTSDSLPLSTVNEYAETYLAQRISTINGVAQVQVFGQQKYAVRVQLDPYALASRGMGIDEVQQAIAAPTSTCPPAPSTARTACSPCRPTASCTTREPSGRSSSPTATARRSASGRSAGSSTACRTTRSPAWFKANARHRPRRPAPARHQHRRSGRQPSKNCCRPSEQIPPAIDIDVLFDRSVTIRASVQEVQFTLMVALALVIMVIFIFLRNVPATIIPSVALPMSIIGTFAFMYMFGHSIDNISLLALTLCVGFVVDDAIVMLENIVRHLEMGKSPVEAALKGSKEIGFTIVSMTISLAAVFIPVMFMGGILGRLLHEFAVVIIVAVLISGFVSLTLTPMMCSRILKPHDPDRKHGAVYMLFERGFDAMRDAYAASLRVVLAHQRLTLMAFFAIVVGTGVLFQRAPKGFLPSEDSGQLFCFVEGPQDISFEGMAVLQQQVADIISQDPNVEALMSFIGTSNFNPAMNIGRITITLKPFGQRKNADEVVRGLRPKLAKLTSVKAFVQNVPTIRIGTLTKAPYQYVVQSASTEELYSWAPRIEAKLRAQPGLTDVTSDLQIARPQVTVEILREKAASLGVSPQQIQMALNNAYGSSQVSTIYTATNQYWVIMELEPRFQTDPAALAMLYVRSSTGALVPLSTLAKFSYGVGPLSVTHLGQLPSVTFSFDLRPGVSLSEAITEVRKGMVELQAPATLNTSFQGTAQAFEKSLQGMGILLLLSILVIYLVLGVLYESFIHPLTILSGLPSAGLGALLTLTIFDVDLSLYAFVGIIMLIGIVKKNAIMMIDFAIEAQRKDGKSAEEAIFEACSCASGRS